MTLRSLEFHNLKCFLALRLSLAPLTLLTGFNSAGKSTALHSILLLAQGLRLGYDFEYLSPNGTLVRLGSPGEVLSSHADERRVQISVSTAEEDYLWSFVPADSDVLPEPRKGMFRVEKTTRRIKGVDDLLEAKGSFRGDDADSSGLINAIGNVVFLNSERGKVSDVYTSPDNANVIHADVGREGQFAPWWYELATDEKIESIRRHPDEPATSLRRQVDAYLNTLFPNTRVTANKVERTGFIQLKFGAGSDPEWHQPANVGYGIVYAFPIIVAALLAKRGQVLIIESPEAHLHPRAQSRMGEILARIASAGVQILVESHSDHVLNGIRLAVKKGIIPHPDVAIHFFGGADSERNHGVVSPSIDSRGTIDKWPEGFFDQGESDLAVLAGWKDS